MVVVGSSVAGVVVGAPVDVVIGDVVLLTVVVSSGVKVGVLSVVVVVSPVMVNEISSMATASSTFVPQ